MRKCQFFTPLTCDGFNVSLNLLVIVSLINYRRTRRHVTTPFIVTLSVLDLVYAGFILPVYAARFANRESPLGDGFCAFFPVIFYCTMGASVLTLTMVGIIVWLRRLIFYWLSPCYFEASGSNS